MTGHLYDLYPFEPREEGLIDLEAEQTEEEEEGLVEEEEFEYGGLEETVGGPWTVRRPRQPSSPRSSTWKRGDGGNHVCSYCQKSFLRISSLRDHKKMHENLTTCRICSKTLSTVANLKNHYIAVHMQTYEQAKILTAPAHAL